ncbi:MAG: malectin domain-containing carbohydrate-binding protein [Bryobacteraceae bacterium]
MTEQEELTESRERAVHEELEHVLGGASFRTSKRCREFLTYIVEHTLRGPKATLKERSIGVDLFQLPHDFDTGQHTIVRVTASEVRKKLAQHYLAENGSAHPVRIDLPPGSYSAEFKWTAPPVIQPPPVLLPPAPRQRPSKQHLVWYLASAVAAIAIAFGLWRSYSGPHAFDRMKSARLAESPFVASSNDAAVRILTGSSNSYVDRSGRAWGPDRFFSGGSVLFRASERISRTLDPDVYRHLRQGDFQYDIPLSPGSYELHLHFAETGLTDFISAESSGEGQRLFRVAVNGQTVLDFFDVVADADGPGVADERVFRNVSPGHDGVVHLKFTSIRGMAVVSAIELVPVSTGAVKPLRIRAGWPSSWRDDEGRQWMPDGYFLGGNALVRSTNPVRESDSMPPDASFYASERWGHFSYALPLPDGRYKVTLKFSEGHYGRRNTGIGGLGSRVFDVYCNGVTLLKDFDIYKEAGGEARPVDRTFSGIRPNAQGKIILSFIPVHGMACVNGIEITEDQR